MGMEGHWIKHGTASALMMLKYEGHDLKAMNSVEQKSLETAITEHSKQVRYMVRK